MIFFVFKTIADSLLRLNVSSIFVLFQIVDLVEVLGLGLGLGLELGLELRLGLGLGAIFHFLSNFRE